MQSKPLPSPELSSDGAAESEKHFKGSVRSPDSMQEAIREELRRVLTSPQFHSSHRCKTLLSYVVENALNGKIDSLKERSIGIDVFGRDLTYDTNSDPVVRMAAGEVRKRLAQYYYDPANKSELRIELPAGSYLPVFPTSDSLLHATEENVSEASQTPSVELQEHPETPAQVSASTHRSRHAARWLIAEIATGVIGILLLVLWGMGSTERFRSTQALLWVPFSVSQEPVLIIAPDDLSLQRVHGANSPEEASQNMAKIIASRKVPVQGTAPNTPPLTPFADVLATVQISKWFTQNNQQSRLVGASGVEFHELRASPVVLIGGLDNAWTLSLLSNLRFSFRADASGNLFWIQDAQHPDNRDWQIQNPEAAGSTFTDYGLITRYNDPETGQWIMAITGTGRDGTLAATDLMTEKAYARWFPASLRACKRNMQIVIKTGVLNSEGGPPQLVTSYCW